MDLKIVLLSLPVILILSIPFFFFFQNYNGKGRSKALIYIICLIFISRFFVNVFQSMHFSDSLSVEEAFFVSILHTAQSLSLNDDYSTYTLNGKEYLTQLGHPILSNIYGLVISFFNFLAPIIAGFMVLSVVTNIFSRFQLFFGAFRHKFVFTELNEGSLTLAEDLYQNKQYKKVIVGNGIWKKPMLIFTNVVFSEEADIDKELLVRARKLNAVLVSDDMLHLNLKRSVSVDYFLINRQSKENISLLSRMQELYNKQHYLWPDGDGQEENPTRIFLFTSNDFEDIMAHDLSRDIRNMTIRTIRDDQNTAMQLMYQTPLFLPLMDRKEKDSLNITLLGNSSIAQEVLKSIYWCGQIPNTKVNVHVLSENASDFRNTILSDCPELLKSCEPTADILKVFPFGSDEKNAPYLNQIAFSDLSLPLYVEMIPKDVLENTDYYVICLNSDEETITFLRRLSLALAQKSLTNEKLRSVVLVPFITNPELSKLLLHNTSEDGEPKILPFGNLTDRYNCQNVFMSTFLKHIANSNALYGKANQEKVQKDEYSFWSTTARTIHAPYKLFGMGILESVDLNDSELTRWHHKPFSFTNEEEHFLAWYEHRRWNAFLRAQGFCCPTKEEYDRYYAVHAAQGKYSLHKNLRLKYHPCLVETSLTPEPLPREASFDKSRYDYLDYVSMYNYQKQAEAKKEKPSYEGLCQNDYKLWDYPAYDDMLSKL